MSTQYRIELGFDWNSSPITGGSIQVEETRNTLDVYPLQIALARESDGSPAFFSGLRGGDQLNFWIFDITDVLGGTPPWPTTGYGSPQDEFDAVIQQSGHDANPFTQAVTWQMVPQPGTAPSFAFSTSGQTYGFSPVNAEAGGPAENWATLAEPANGTAATFELSVKLTLELNGETKTFVTDPELIVDEGGG